MRRDFNMSPQNNNFGNAPTTFIVELPRGEPIDNFGAATCCPKNHAKGKIVHCFDTLRPSASYWINWGGTYDNPDDTLLTLFISTFLTKVDTLNDMYLLDYSSFTSGTLIYFNIPYYLWQYISILSRIEVFQGYSTGVSDFLNPSNDTYNGSRYPVRMSVPKLPLKLSDPLNGIYLSPTFSVELANDDGEFDSFERSMILNSPVTIKKSTTYPATYESFKNIRTGLIDNVSLDMDNFTIKGSDYLRTLKQPVTRTFKNAGISESDDMLPIAYGTFSHEKLIEFSKVEAGGTVTTFKYVVCDPEYISSSNMVVYDSEDTVIPSSKYDFDSGIITINVDSATEDKEPDNCDFHAKQSDIRLGEIITYEITEKASIPRTNSFWNLNEVDGYIARSPFIDLYFKSGTVKKLVKEILKNDMAFLIQQNDGRLTIREWETGYSFHRIPSWNITKKPKRSFSDSNNYSSSVVVEYKGNKKFLNDRVESDAISKWKKRVLKEFKTTLTSEEQAVEFSEKILRKFATRSEYWTVSIGKDTSGIELLDTICLHLDINGRKLSRGHKWKVTGIDPSQDSLILEERGKEPPVEHIPLSHPFINYENGFLAQPSIYYEDGFLAQPTLSKDE